MSLICSLMLWRR